MSTLILRRRKLGRTSVRAIRDYINGRNLTNGPVGIGRADLLVDWEGVTQVVRWGYTGNVPVRNVVNTAAAIHEVNNKRDFRIALSEAGYNSRTFTDNNPPSVRDFPIVVRPPVHAQGRNLYVARNTAAFTLAIAACGPDWYGSTLIDKVAEYRVFIVRGRVVAVANKVPADREAVAWNVARGGVFENVRWDDWPLKAVRIAVEAFCLSDLDFGGVDVMVDRDNNCYVLEINSAPSLTSPYRQECMAKGIADIINNGKDRIPLTRVRGNYRKFIHPAVFPGALVD